jgi:signal transduction histidine kinase
MEQQRAVELERQRIAANIHDDLGASLTRITLLSDLAREGAIAGGISAEMDQIHRTSRQLTRSMDEIVWAVDPEHDTLDSLVSYLGKFAQDLLAAANVRCRLQFPVTVPVVSLNSQVRHNLFLAVKEALHNVVKHAAATESRLQFSLESDAFVLTVSDNGRGFNPGEPAAHSVDEKSDRISSGHGLKNIARRLNEIGGRCEVISAPGQGTEIRLRVPFPQD